jgi:hypothetical protein
MNKWKNEINLNYTYLDMIDLQPYLEKATTINELMCEVQHDYENNKFPEHFNLFIHAFEDDWVFNYLSDYYSHNLNLHIYYSHDYFLK